MRASQRRVPLVLALIAALLTPSAALAQTIQELYGTDGTVTAVTRANGIVYIGGTFNTLGPVVGPGTGVEPVTGQSDPNPWPKVKGAQVNSVIPDGSGGWYVGGQFTHVGGVPRNNLAHILADHTVGSWNPGTNSGVNALVLSGTTLYVAGSFTTIGGQVRGRLAAVDAVTGAVLSWNPNAAGGYPYAMALAGSTMYVGGGFTQISGMPRGGLAAVDAVTGVPTAWGPYAGSTVYALAWSGTTLYVAGTFSTIGGQPRNGIAAYDGSGNLLSWNPNCNGGVNAVVPSGGIVYVGGNFTAIGGQARNFLAALDATTALATAWNPNPTNGGAPIISALSEQGGSLYVGGVFTAIGGQSRRNARRSARRPGMPRRGIRTSSAG